MSAVAAGEFGRCRQRLEQAVGAVGGLEGEWADGVVRAVQAALDLAAADPAGALVLTARAPARWKRREPEFTALVDHFGALLDRGAPSRNPRLPDARAIVVLIARQVNLQIELGRAAELPDLAPDLTFLALFPYLGYTEARRRAHDAPQTTSALTPAG